MKASEGEGERKRARAAKPETIRFRPVLSHSLVLPTTLALACLCPASSPLSFSCPHALKEYVHHPLCIGPRVDSPHPSPFTIFVPRNHWQRSHRLKLALLSRSSPVSCPRPSPSFIAPIVFVLRLPRSLPTASMPEKQVKGNCSTVRHNVSNSLSLLYFSFATYYRRSSTSALSWVRYNHLRHPSLSSSVIRATLLSLSRLHP